VTGLGLAAKLLEAGRAKATAEGLDIKWRDGDAENLPFEDGSFDRSRRSGYGAVRITCASSSVTLRPASNSSAIWVTASR
jgi:hypothetical protein